MMGGIDKRELAKDRQAIYREIMCKVPYLIERGGYIPHVDHAIPPDVSLANFTYYRELLRKVILGQRVSVPSVAV
jgi:uroporphyrinogen decarboxylase